MPTSNPVFELFPSVKKRNIGTQTFANNTPQTMIWSSTAYDNFGHEVSSFILRCKKRGIYKIGAYMRLDLPANFLYYLQSFKDGGNIQTDIRYTSVYTNYKLSIDAEELLNVGDEITFGFFQNTGGGIYRYWHE